MQTISERADHMGRVAILTDPGKSNDFYTRMWHRAFTFWGIPYDSLTIDTLKESEVDFNILLLTGMDNIPAATYRMLDKYIEKGGRILISGDLPAGFKKYFNGLSVRKIQRTDLHRCIRIRNKNGFKEWEDGEILFFTSTYNCGGLDFIIDSTEITDADIPAVSEEMSQSPINPGVWEGWKSTSSPALIRKSHEKGKILYTPFAIGAMNGLIKPNTADSIEYLYPKQNHGLYFFIRNLLEYLTEDEKLQYKELWPNGSRCVVCITGDVHDYTGIPGREDREWDDMKYNFDLLDEYGLDGKASYYVCGEVARKHPEVIREGLERGYELCPHTYQETQYAIEKWDYKAQREDVLRCIDAFEKAAPDYDAYKKGFRTHGYQSNEITRQALQDLGYEYIGDMQAWETTGEYNAQYPDKLVNFAACPQYLSDESSDGLLEIPDTFANDHFVYRVMKLSPKQALDFWKKQFDKYYRLGGLYQACLHPYISLKEDPERERTYRELLEYILSHKGVTFMTMAELNKWWKKRDKNSQTKGWRQA